MHKKYKILIVCLSFAIFVSLVIFLSFSSQKNSANKKKYFATSFETDDVTDNSVIEVTNSNLQNYHNSNSYGLKINRIEISNYRGSIEFTAKKNSGSVNHICGKISILKKNFEKIYDNDGQISLDSNGKPIIDENDPFIGIYNGLENDLSEYKSMYIYVDFSSGSNEKSSFIIYDNADFRFVNDFEFSVDEEYCQNIEMPQ